jgi:hypothetical protein
MSGKEAAIVTGAAGAVLARVWSKVFVKKVMTE